MSTVNGSPNGDVLDGSLDDDTIIGAAGNDDLLGYSGDDVLMPGPGVDYLDGGMGSDTVSYEDIDFDNVTVFLGPDVDAASRTSSARGSATT
jgi:Ca2+-binding RTX toxin-like protein